jgi:hypothetical protein
LRLSLQKTSITSASGVFDSMYLFIHAGQALQELFFVVAILHIHIYVLYFTGVILPFFLIKFFCCSMKNVTSYLLLQYSSTSIYSYLSGFVFSSVLIVILINVLFTLFPKVHYLYVSIKRLTCDMLKNKNFCLLQPVLYVFSLNHRAKYQLKGFLAKCC